MWIWAATAWATTYSVTPTSYPSLTDALDLAVAGDTVEVGAGTYTVTAAVEENVEVVGTGVVLFVPASGGVPMLEFRKGGALRDVQLDALGIAPAVKVNSGEDFVLSGVTIWNGAGTDGGALEARGAGSLVITSSTFEGNTAQFEGGAVFSRRDTTITGSSFTNNIAEGEGGAVYVDDADTTLVGVTFVRNRSLYATGGALTAANGTVTSTGSVWDGNEAGLAGGALRLDQLANATLSGDLFCLNLAASGGAVSSGNGTGSAASHTAFVGNEAGGGGALSVGASWATQNNSFRANVGVGAAVEGPIVSVADVFVDHATLAVTDAASDHTDPWWWSNTGGDTNGTQTGAVTADPLFAPWDGTCSFLAVAPGFGSPLIGSGAGVFEGFGGPVIDADGDGFPIPADCDDTDPYTYPGAPEIPDGGTDQDCDGFELCAFDDDSDGFDGVREDALGGCAIPTTELDCDDADASVYPGATEVPVDGIDQDCDGEEACWVDADRDGYGDETVAPEPGPLLSAKDFCGEDGLARAGNDCDDTTEFINPGVVEFACDGIDNDCNPKTLDCPGGTADTGPTGLAPTPTADTGATADTQGTLDTDPGTDPTVDSSTDPLPTTPDDEAKSAAGGCGCITPAGHGSAAWLLMGALALARRRTGQGRGC